MTLVAYKRLFGSTQGQTESVYNCAFGSGSAILVSGAANATLTLVWRTHGRLALEEQDLHNNSGSENNYNDVWWRPA